MVKLQDANFFVSKKRVEEFADEIIKRGLKIRWYSTVRSEYFRRYDGEFCSEYFKDMLEYLDLTKNEFTEIVNKHRNPEIWKKTDTYTTR